MMSEIKAELDSSTTILTVEVKSISKLIYGSAEWQRPTTPIMLGISIKDGSTVDIIIYVDPSCESTVPFFTS